MYTAVIILIIIDAILLGIVVLLQNSKGGGLTSEFSSSNQIMGVRKTTDFLEKATWTLAIILVVLSFATSFIGKNVSRGDEGERVSKAQSGQSMSTPLTQPAATAAEMPTESEMPVEAE